MRRKSFAAMRCSIARSLDLVGEWWTMLVVREAFMGTTRFDAFQRNLGIAPNILSARLKRLVASAVLQRMPTASAAGRAASPPPMSRTERLLAAPVLPTLLRLAAPNLVVILAQAAANFMESYFLGRLGTEALAGAALVFPLIMLMQMLSAGAVGGGIFSAIARAIGGGRLADAEALALHAVVIALALGIIVGGAVYLGGPALYQAMGGSGPALTAALSYSNVVFARAVTLWLLNSLASILRGTGNMVLPALVPGR